MHAACNNDEAAFAPIDNLNQLNLMDLAKSLRVFVLLNFPLPSHCYSLEVCDVKLSGSPMKGFGARFGPLTHTAF